MSIFGFGMKKEDKKTVTLHSPDLSGKIKNIKVLGAGCRSCHQQYENAKKAVSVMKLPVTVEYITDMERIMTYGAMSMPAIVINDKVASAGNVLKPSDVAKLIIKSAT